ncbi:hypothetical protein K469DRAFT_683349 [Zopfia rhizophila CBS 207.26]|uniref:Uncharacterized protein n=1 Tax=Zopfia rhizophila CBS 207.26 TaxID=1314779 RepID=A0A6A6D8T3_9PEZI|nr:hypothetical protein K469DRAFT_683349 [Zopfia rhizophila CBS 207.26]
MLRVRTKQNTRSVSYVYSITTIFPSSRRNKRMAAAAEIFSNFNKATAEKQGDTTHSISEDDSTYLPIMALFAMFKLKRKGKGAVDAWSEALRKPDKPVVVYLDSYLSIDFKKKEE